MSGTDTVEFESFLASVGTKDRLNLQRHMAALDAEPGPGHARLWRRLILTLRRLAPHAVQTVGQYAVQFFVADGKYRMQVFTVEDKRDGTLLVYLPDVMEEATKAKILGKPSRTAKPAPPADGVPACPSEFPIVAKAGEMLCVEALNGANLPEPPPHVRHMLGWNRRALRVSVPAVGAPAQAAAIEALCTLAAKAWANAPAPAAAPAGRTAKR